MGEAARAIGVLTSGGDAPGMNAAVRAIVRSALDRGVDVVGIHEGFEGLVRGGDLLRPLSWASVGGILQRGGTVIGTARSETFRTLVGRRAAARHLVAHDVDRLIVIGGDGSLTGADLLRREWADHLAGLVEEGALAAERAAAHADLTIVGLVGSIDNDMQGTDLTIGAKTALHRITEAIDAIQSTAASHQRTFVVEVMGRHCGWLAVMGALATGADWVLIPESPPDVDDWEATMCARLAAGRAAGRRASIVVVAEGAIDRHGRPITIAHVKAALRQRLGEDVRETILGHVQRGGSPCALDRNMSSLLGHAAVATALDPASRGRAVLLGMVENRIHRTSLVDAVADTHRVAEAIEEQRFERVMALRGERFVDAWQTLQTLVRAVPRAPPAGKRRLRLAVMHADAPAPGMNTAVRAAVRVGMDHGHEMRGVRGGLPGLVKGAVEPLDWMSVNGWAGRGGAELGTQRTTPSEDDWRGMARTIEAEGIDGILMIGGWTGYRFAHELHARQREVPAFRIPVVCLPANITNNLPGTELCVGSDTALNSIVRAVDAIKQSAVASQRAFVVEVMGWYCGYLALMGGLATGAERVYLHEEGVTLADLQADVGHLVAGFEHGKRLGLVLRSEKANEVYDTDFMVRLFEEEGGDLFEVRWAILGHLQQGGDPSPLDRTLATRLATRCVAWLDAQGEAGSWDGAAIGVEGGHVRTTPIEDLPQRFDESHLRPREQWWMASRPVARLLAQPGPRTRSLSRNPEN